MRVVRAFQYEKIEQPRASLRASSSPSHIDPPQSTKRRSVFRICCQREHLLLV
jgi:hypothetical protein